MADDVGRLAHLFRWCGMALVAAGVLMVVATLLHPSRETATTIVASESRLVAAHVVLHGCLVAGAVGPSRALCGSTWRDGTAGIGGLPDRFRWHVLDCGDGELRFPRPRFWPSSRRPCWIPFINYVHVLIVNGLAAILFMIGYVLFGIAMIRTAALSRWSGVLVAVRAPAHLLGFGIAQLVATAAWPIAILGSGCLGAGLGWAGLSALAGTETLGRGCFR